MLTKTTSTHDLKTQWSFYILTSSSDKRERSLFATFRDHREYQTGLISDLYMLGCMYLILDAFIFSLNFHMWIINKSERFNE